MFIEVGGVGKIFGVNLAAACADVFWSSVIDMLWNRSEHHHWILYIGISPGTKFQLKLTSLI